MKAVTVKSQKRGVGKRNTVIVGLGVSNKAVERNKIRRRIRAIMQKNADSGKNYVIIAHPAAKTISFQELQKEIEKQSLILNP